MNVQFHVSKWDEKTRDHFIQGMADLIVSYIKNNSHENLDDLDEIHLQLSINSNCNKTMEVKKC